MTWFRETLSRSRPPLGTWVKLPTIESVELLAIAGFDFVVIDLEHSPMSLESVSALVAMARARSLCALVRVPDHTSVWIQRCLDLGAAGVVVPHVDDAEQARVVGRAARFEPRGTRGVGPTSRAGDWGLIPQPDYLAQQDQVVVIAQIESPAGLANAADIIADPNIDALFVGPADLGQALGVTNDSSELTDAMTQVSRVAHAASLPVGIAVGAVAARAADLVSHDFDFVMVSNDATILGSGAASLTSGYRDACGH